ncbi:MAG: hypothetical protein MZU97_04145 [Bacillus subtilis]|nr:hypothetical protein [Bacillus subtilis]
MTNVDYQTLNQFRDVEVFTEYKNFRARGLTDAEALQVLRDRSRDNARTPMQWSDEDFAGFSATHPWIDVVGNYPTINVKNQADDKDSILSWYKTLLHLRRRRSQHYPRNDYFSRFGKRRRFLLSQPWV